MRIVAVDAPRLQRALHDEVVTGAADMVHDFFAAPFLYGFADACTERLEHLLPRGAGPLPCSALPSTLHRIEHAVGIMNLINGRGTLGAQASAARRMHRIPFELID